MNTRTSGVVIAVSAAVAGSLIPSTVHAYLDGLYIIALGLGVIVALNAGIALLHIADRGKAMADQDSDDKASTASTPRHALAASNVNIQTKRGKVASEQRPEPDTVTPATTNP